MPKFLNKKYNNTVSDLVEGLNNRLKNPYYIFNDRQPTLTDYYNQSELDTSLDENLQQEYADLGENSPIRFNKIEGLVLYGIPKLEANYTITDNGFESDPLQGEAIILPNTIIPKKGDFFRIQYLDQPLLFKVISSTTDTIDNLSNFYRIQWIYERPDCDDIEKQVVDNFTAVTENSGTEYKSVIKNSEYKFIDRIEEVLTILKEYYKVLFYSTRVQAFIFSYKEDFFYDPYAVEFIIKHNLISTLDDYLYITQQCALHNTFVFEYDKSLFNAIEKCDKNIGKYKSFSQAEYIQDVFGVFSYRSEPYFKILYRDYMFPSKDIINFIDEDLISRIDNNILYDEKELSYKNIIIKYFNNSTIKLADLDNIPDIQYTANVNLFYEILFIIYILEKNVKNLLK